MVFNMVYYQTMIKLNINQAKTHLSAYLARLRQGETIVLCKRNSLAAASWRTTRHAYGYLGEP